ncbi:MAG: TetR/AcrR family transcriptional regulator [Clostridia bacterium]|nr:TetR/AcrR family transcriptional regulator [Clostridia bacterium]
MNFLRAVSEEQKSERRQKILDSALSIFEQSGFKSTNMAEIAQKSGIAKGSVFLYFKTKEELFMHLLGQELGKWNNAYDEALNMIEDKSLGSKELMQLFVDTLMQNTVLIRLVALVNTIFGQNVSHEQVVTFKKEFLNRIRRTGDLLDRKVRFFSNGTGVEFYMHCYVLVTGLSNLSDPVPAIKDVVKTPDYAILNVNLKAYLTRMLKLLLTGLENVNNQY